MVGSHLDVTEKKQAIETLREHEAQLLAAQQIQERLLPQSAPNLPGFDIAGGCHPAEFAGGDYFDYLPMADRTLGLVIADVSGHGFAPALLMSAVQSHLRALVDIHAEMDVILHRVNARLVERTEESRFVTLFFAQIDPVSRRLTYVNAGHPPGFVLDKSGNLKSELASTAFLLGVLPDAEFIPKDYGVLEPGDLLLLLTDGVLEAPSPDGIPFGVDRALGVVRDSSRRRRPRNRRCSLPRGPRLLGTELASRRCNGSCRQDASVKVACKAIQTAEFMCAARLLRNSSPGVEKPLYQQGTLPVKLACITSTPPDARSSPVAVAFCKTQPHNTLRHFMPPLAHRLHYQRPQTKSAAKFGRGMPLLIQRFSYERSKMVRTACYRRVSRRFQPCDV